ncbi:MAG TPA: diadenylate cyclase [Verrucomicrobiales bacterium]|jgi:diadenylate cyclase|nr:diadenylate cyclase [Verrucomicrobiales bacterium]
MGEFLTANWRPIIEVTLMVGSLFVAWRYMRYASGARLLAVIGGIVGVLFVVAYLLRMDLIRSFALFCGLVLVVIFQPEVRRAFVSLGSHRLFSARRASAEFLDIMQEAVQQLSAKRFGALFAFERGMDLDQFVETGVEIDASFTPELVLTIFHPKTALHDGGMVLRNGRIQGAGCVFPVSQRELADRSIGLRHRAAMGITEQTDAIAVVVSEETGQISICAEGTLFQALTPLVFRERLAQFLTERNRDGDREKEKETVPDRAATQRLEA